jgi:hypothetical protein
LAGPAHLTSWFACHVLPYALFFSVIPLLTWPPYEIVRHLYGGRHTNLTEYAATFVVWGTGIWVSGLALAAVNVSHAPERFLRDLRRPT